MDQPFHSSLQVSTSVGQLDKEGKLNMRMKQRWIMPYFPDGLLEEILCRMPVRSLVQFKCVCKSWRDLISSEDFINLHLMKYETSVILVNSGARDDSGSRGSISPVHLPSTPRNAISRVDFAMPGSVNNNVLGNDLFLQITGACNGIICLWDVGNLNSIALWNPATKDLKIIPETKLPLRSKWCMVLFGYDDVRNDYKIVRFLLDDVGGFVQFQIYSLNSGLWKKLDISDVIKEPREDLVTDMHSTGGKIVSWLVLNENKTGVGRRWELVLFDMSTEIFESVQVPVEASVLKQLVLRPYEGSIGIMHGISRNRGWVLSDIKSLNGELRSWRKVVPKCPTPRSLLSIAFWKDHVLYHDHGTSRFTMFDCGRLRFSEVGVCRYRWVFTATRYKESLVRLL